MKKVFLVILLVSQIFGYQKNYKWYIGIDKNIDGTGTRDIKYTDTNIKKEYDTNFFSIKGGYITRKKDKIELEFTKKNITYTGYYSGEDSINELKINYILLFTSLSYKKFIFPYLKGGIGFGSSNEFSKQFLSQFELGFILNLYKFIEINIGFRHSLNYGSFIQNQQQYKYTDNYDDILTGILVKFNL